MYWSWPATLKITVPRCCPENDVITSPQSITSVLLALTTFVAGGGTAPREPSVATLPGSVSTIAVNTASTGPEFDRTKRQIQPAGCCANTVCSSTPSWMMRENGFGAISSTLYTAGLADT